MSEQLQQDMTEEISQSSAEVLDWPSPGARLRKMREEQKLSQADVAEPLHLTIHYINALEQDEYQKLPGRIFAKGYIRSYATLLGADPDELVAWYERFTAAHEASRQEQEVVRSQRSRQDQSRIWLVGAALILVVFVGLSWWFAGREDEVMNATSTTVGGAVNEVERSDPLAVERATAVGGDGADAGRLVAGQFSPVESGITDEESMLVDVAVDTAVMAPESLHEQRDDSEATQSSENAREIQEESPAGSESVLNRRLEQTEEGRVISLQDEGEDLIDIMTHGRSWIEVDNGEGDRLFNDLLQEGDALHIRSDGPFNILFGDASQVAVDFNDKPVDIGSMIRSDNSARIVLER